MAGPQQFASVVINLDFPRVRLHQQIQRAIDLVAFGLTAAAQAQPCPPLPGRAPDLIQIPDTFLALTTDSKNAMNFEGARTTFPIWVLGCGLRDAVEAISDFLEEVRVACRALSFGPSPGVSMDTFNAAVPRESKEGQKFRQENFPRKLAILQDQFGLTPQLAAHVLSINRARACLVHRGGVVARVDCNEPDLLKVKWIRVEMRVEGSKGPMPVGPREPLPEGGKIILEIVDAERTFQMGATVMFSGQEFNDICYAITNFAHQATLAVGEYSQRAGIEPAAQPPATEEEPRE